VLGLNNKIGSLSPDRATRKRNSTFVLRLPNPFVFVKELPHEQASTVTGGTNPAILERSTASGSRDRTPPARVAALAVAASTNPPLPAATNVPVDMVRPFFAGPFRYVNVAPASEGPLFSTHNHDPALTVFPSGDVFILHYTCDTEFGHELAVVATRLPAGASTFTPPLLFYQCADANNHAPALFVDADNAMRIAREEIFGPVAALIPARDYEHALAIANDTDFGLCGGIVTASLKYATHFKRNAEVGMAMVNLPTAGVDFHAPFGGRKASSLGSREQGRYAVEFYTTVKTAYTPA